MGTVTDELHWGIDFVGDAGGQLADGFHFMGLGQLDLGLLAFGDILDAKHNTGDCGLPKHIAVYRPGDAQRTIAVDDLEIYRMAVPCPLTDGLMVLLDLGRSWSSTQSK